MSFFPSTFDPHADVIGKLDLVSIHTVDGYDHRFILGADGRFTDIDGNLWLGSTLLQQGDLQVSIGGVAPSGTLTLTYFQDPDLTEDLIQQIKTLGQSYIADQPITFWVQPFTDHAQLWQPTMAPIKTLTRIMKSLSFKADGPLNRSITLAFETSYAGRNESRGYFYSTTDHAKLIGAANPSLTFMPLDDFQPEKLFG